MAFEKGSLIFANYTAWVKDTGEGIESTVESEAKRLKIYEEARRYEPRLVAVGEGWLITGLDAEVAKLSVGDKKEIELSPEKAFGNRDPTQLRMIPLRKFGDREHELAVGDSVDVDNRVGIVRFIGSGRAQVDFNHRLAGKSIVYDFEVLKKVEADGDKVRALIDRRLAGEGSRATFELNGGNLTVTVPQDLFLVEGLQIIKRGIANDVFKFVPAISSLAFVETFKNEKVLPKEERSEGAGAGKAQPDDGKAPVKTGTNAETA
ncbi:MAG: FKBP-type peptidyl-prolyl cis-trans isomerase [Nitrososphaerota archaeon]|nr:FKBP-type peptidyl-prolyl cis-trans isomerase [Nitrososphaerota archaeon]MDG7013573.1 FKBP-type peptidyl-prolyl cis-trans isomerase [Nitrososphaerota archaeon]MDG7025843.1 FKBP-type peptidyl-prolyl cis-trans isomerase [Nitrososphaerota archaeon]